MTAPGVSVSNPSNAFRDSIPCNADVPAVLVESETESPVSVRDAVDPEGADSFGRNAGLIRVVVMPVSIENTLIVASP